MVICSGFVPEDHMPPMFMSLVCHVTGVSTPEFTDWVLVRRRITPCRVPGVVEPSDHRDACWATPSAVAALVTPVFAVVCAVAAALPALVAVDCAAAAAASTSRIAVLT